jgi:hypothetical protein
MDEPTYVASDVNEDDNPPVVFKLMPLEYTDGLSLLAEGLSTAARNSKSCLRKYC